MSHPTLQDLQSAVGSLASAENNISMCLDHKLRPTTRNAVEDLLSNIRKAKATAEALFHLSEITTESQL